METAVSEGSGVPYLRCGDMVRGRGLEARARVPEAVERLGASGVGGRSSSEELGSSWTVGRRCWVERGISALGSTAVG